MKKDPELREKKEGKSWKLAMNKIKGELQDIEKRKRKKNKAITPTASDVAEDAQWFRTAKNPNVSTGPLAHPFACLLTHPLVLSWEFD